MFDFYQFLCFGEVLEADLHRASVELPFLRTVRVSAMRWNHHHAAVLIAKRSDLYFYVYLCDVFTSYLMVYNEKTKHCFDDVMWFRIVAIALRCPVVPRSD